MKWRKVMAFSLAASMIAGQAVSAAPAAEAASESALQTQADSKSNTNASYTDPWTKTAVPSTQNRQALLQRPMWCMTA